MLYAFRVVVGVYAVVTVAGPAPGTSSSDVLIGLNVLSLLAALVVYNTDHLITGLVRVSASCVTIIVLTFAAENILFALLIQVAGLFGDIENACVLLLLLQGSATKPTGKNPIQTARVFP